MAVSRLEKRHPTRKATINVKSYSTQGSAFAHLTFFSVDQEGIVQGTVRNCFNTGYMHFLE